jgi:23S rRNA (uracil1939-C5)-methyltransferase
MRRELTIARFGNQGDGVAEAEHGPIYVPFALAGERIAAEVDGERGTLIELLAAAPERIAPLCPHFGVCGGCAIQHLDWRRYLDWKQQRVIQALSMEGIDAPMAPPLAVGPHSRRRVTFAAGRSGREFRFGFRRALSHEIIDVEVCPILVGTLEAAIPALRSLAADLVPEGETRVLVTVCENGLDVNIDGGKGKLRPIKPAIAAAAERAGIIRITHEDAPVFSMAVPRIHCSGVAVDLPPRAFLQASAEAEAAMAAFAVEAVGKARRIADLYCGLGAFTFALARKAAVTAVELDKNLLATLETAARRAQGLRPITPLRRDLAREPLSPMELKAFDAVLFDPPRAGAPAQARALAKSSVATVVAISCNPATFAKDARTLIAGGYRLDQVLPVDQFTFSAHIEVAALFKR